MNENTNTSGTWSLVRSAGFFVLGAIVTAIVSTIIAMYFSRPRLEVYLTSVSIDTPSQDAQNHESAQRRQAGMYSYGSQLPRNADLIKLSTESDWVPSLAYGNFDTYLSTLYEVRQRSGSAKDSLRALATDLANWPDPITPASMDTVYDILRANSSTVDAVIFGDQVEHKQIFQGDPPSPQSNGRLFEIGADSDGDFYVHSGRQRLPILWVEDCQREGGGAAECKELAERYANAVAYCLQDDLRQLKATLDRDTQDVGELTRLYKESTAEIERYSYWRVTVTLTNDGKEPLAVSPWAMMRIQRPEEEPASTANVLAPTAQPVKPAMISIPLQIVESVSQPKGDSGGPFQYEQPTDAPAVIEGGKAISVTFRSVDRISTSELGSSALQLFKSHKRGSSVTVAVVPLTSPKGPKRKVALSQEMDFRDLGSF